MPAFTSLSSSPALFTIFKFGNRNKIDHIPNRGTVFDANASTVVILLLPVALSEKIWKTSKAAAKERISVKLIFN